MKDYNIDGFISTMARGQSEPYEDFPDYFIKRYLPSSWVQFQNDINSGKIAVIKGKGWTLKYDEDHYCDCDFCDHDSEIRTDFFCTKKEAEDKIKQILKVNPDWEEDDEYSLFEGPYFIKAVKQESGELFS